MKKLENRDKKTFYKINEEVARTSPMRTHYHSDSFLERAIWGKKKQIINQMLKLIKYKTVIDIGCGDGGLFNIVKKDAQYTGVDISPTQLKAFKELVSTAKNKPTLIKADVEKIPIKDNKFDVAIACDILEHVLDPIAVMSEVRRIVKKNGYIIIGIPNENLLELARLCAMRFPLRSPDHIYAIYPEDIKEHFPQVLKRVGVPLNLIPQFCLLNIFLIKNEDK